MVTYIQIYFCFIFTSKYIIEIDANINNVIIRGCSEIIETAHTCIFLSKLLKIGIDIVQTTTNNLKK